MLRAPIARAILTAAVVATSLPSRSTALAGGSPSGGAKSDKDSPTTTAIDQATIDAAMARLREKQEQRRSAPSATPAAPAASPQPAARVPVAPNPPTAKAAPGTQPSDQLARPDPDDYTRELVTSKKLDLLRAYDVSLSRARQALRKREVTAAVVRDLLQEQSILMRMPLEKFRDLLYDVDQRNAERVDRYRTSFGDLRQAGKTVVTILMKAGAIDSAVALPDDPLSEELEQARGVRRVYFQFYLPSRNGATAASTGQQRRQNGYIEFELSLSQGLWVPVWANLDGEPLALFDAEAFVPLRPYRITFDPDTDAFVVAQEQPARLAPVFSLLAPAGGTVFARPK